MTDDFTSDGLYIHALREMPDFRPLGRPRRPALKPAPKPDGVCRCARPIVWGQGGHGFCERCRGYR